MEYVPLHEITRVGRPVSAAETFLGGAQQQTSSQFSSFLGGAQQTSSSHFSAKFSKSFSFRGKKTPEIAQEDSAAMHSEHFDLEVATVAGGHNGGRRYLPRP